MNRFSRLKRRDQKGASTIVLTLIIAFFAVLPLALLSFEMSRFFLIQSELQHVLDCAALSGTAALASSQTGLTVDNQQALAMQAAYSNFCQNSILQVPFNTGNTTATLNTGVNTNNPDYQNAIINITLQDQNGVVQKTGSLTATTMKISAAYTDRPAFFSPSLNPTGGNFTVRAYAVGGLPQLDLVLCFDISGSMDDQTVVHFVNRHWDGTKVSYTDLVTPDTIYNLTQPGQAGSSLNATQPQNLSFANYAQTGYANPYLFCNGPNATLIANLRANTSTGTTGTPPEQGCPPGNYNPSTPTSASGNGINWNAYPGKGFTDMVYVPSGYSVQSAVEASRGNLVSTAILKASQGGTISSELTGASPSYNISPTSYTDYWNAVNQAAQPITSARQAAVNFFNLMNTSANVHISLVAFSTTSATLTTGPGGLFVDPNNKNSYITDINWTPGGTGKYPLPCIPLNKTTFNVTDVINAVNGVTGSPGTAPLNATGQTDMADALTVAINELTDKSLTRPSATKACILFTDGIPNQPIVPSDPLTNALTVAGTANSNNIPIYTIGLSTNPLITTAEATALGDGTSNSDGKQGIAYKSGNGASYTPVSNPAGLQNAFQSIARSLVVLQSQAQ